MSPLELDLLGAPRIRARAAALPLERKAAALLALLALDGPSARTRVAGLLWPDSPEETARANLRQLLRRIRVACGADPTTGGEPLALAPAVRADVRAALDGELGERSALPLLAGLDFADCPELDSWLQAARERVTAAQVQALAAAGARSEAGEDPPAAISYAERQLQLAPFSEELWRRLMGLHHRAGDRLAALAAYARCKELLRRELDAAPDAETEQLARALERSRAPASSRPPRPVLPPSVLRPPLLVGREREWELMERAWEAGQQILLVGEPGSGKTRLARDFAATKGKADLVWARPGDGDVPYSTLVRHVRRRLEAGQQLKLPAWARREAARVVPDLHPDPPEGPADRVRLVGALAQVLRQCAEPFDLLVVDDLQYLDEASLEVSIQVLTQYSGDRGFHRLIDCMRKGEASPPLRERLELLERAQEFAVIELSPLSSDGVGAFLRSLELPGAEALGGELVRYTGGNPLFLVETVRLLVELGGLDRGWTGRLPAAGRVRAVILQRLARLSAAARDLAQVAALAGTAFSLDLAAEVLQVRTLALAPAVRELEEALVLRGTRFTHDLLFEAVVDSVPAAVAPALHDALAAALAGRGAPAALVARHLVAAGRPERAVPYLIAAADADHAVLREGEAAGALGQAIQLLEAGGRHDEAAQLRRRLASG